MATARTPGSAAEVAAIRAGLHELADHPGQIERMRGRQPLDGLRNQSQDSRRPTEPQASGPFVADYSSVVADQAANDGSGLL